MEGMSDAAPFVAIPTNINGSVKCCFVLTKAETDLENSTVPVAEGGDENESAGEEENSKLCLNKNPIQPPTPRTSSFIYI